MRNRTGFAPVHPFPTAAPWRAIFAGFAVLMVAMGIGRFAYTPILPAMERAARFSPAFWGLLATVNYAGYLLGAIGAARWPRGASRLTAVYGALLVSVVTTEAMGYATSPIAWAVLRGLGGVASAGVFVWISSVLLDWMAALGRTEWAGLMYAGVGTGIILTGVATPGLLAWGGWMGAWRGLGVIALLLGLLARWSMPTPPVAQAAARTEGRHAGTEDRDDESPPFWRLLVAYAIEGCGYIVMGTFDVSLLSHLPGLRQWGMWSWTFVGLAAAPSAWGWSRLARRYGSRRVLLWAFGLQAVGVVLPVLWPTAVSALLSALLFGGTFMGIATVALAAARVHAPADSARAIGAMTVVFGVGQMVGPGLAGWVAAVTHSETVAFLGSGVLLLVAVTVLLRFRAAPAGRAASAGRS